MSTKPASLPPRERCCCGPARSRPSPSRSAGSGPAGWPWPGWRSRRRRWRVAAPRAGRAPAQAAGPAADRAVRAGRDDRVPAAAQRRGAGGARGHGQPAGGDRAGVRQPAGGGVPGRASTAAGAGPGSAVALAGTALIAASHGLGFGASALIVLAAAVLQGIFHTAQKPLLARYTGFEVTAYAMWAGTVFILPWTGSLLRALWGPGRTRAGRPSARRSSSAWRRRRPGSCCGPTPWRGWTSGGSPSACTWCRPPRSESRWSGWARSRARPS